MPNLKLKSVTTSPVRAVVGSPVIRKDSRTGINLTLSTGNIGRKLLCQLGSPLGGAVELEVEEVSRHAAPALLRKQHSTNDNYCILNPGPSDPVSRLCPKCSKTRLFCDCLTSCIVSCCQSCTFCLKCAKAVAKERHKSFIKVKKRNKFCERCFYCRSLCFCLNCSQCPQCCSWQTFGRFANPRVVSILKDGYILPFKLRPPLVRDPLISSGYANPLRNLYLKEALHALIIKKAAERVRVQTSLAFFNRLFIVPKPNQKWWPILDLSALNKFWSVKTFKMETPETI